MEAKSVLKYKGEYEQPVQHSGCRSFLPRFGTWRFLVLQRGLCHIDETPSDNKRWGRSDIVLINSLYVATF